MKKHVVIIGAGIAGLTVATKLLNRDLDITVIDRCDDIGGLAKTVYKDKSFPVEHSLRIYHDNYFYLKSILKDIPHGDKKIIDNLIPLSVFIDDSKNNFIEVQTGDHSFLAKLKCLIKMLSFFRNRKLLFNDYFLMLKQIYLFTLSRDRLFQKYGILTNGEFNKNASENFKNTIFSLLQIPTAATDNTSILNIIELANMVTPFTNAFVLNGPTSDRLFDPWKKYLEQNNVHFMLGTEIIDFNFSNNKIDFFLSKSKEKITGDAYVLAVPGFVSESLLNKIKPTANIQKNIPLNYVFLSGVRFLLKDIPDNFKNMISGPCSKLTASINSPWCLSYMVLGPPFWDGTDTSKQWKYMLHIDIAKTQTNGNVYNKPFLECSKEEIINEVLHQLNFNRLDLIVDCQFDHGLNFIKNYDYGSKKDSFPPNLTYQQKNGDWIVNVNPYYCPVPDNFLNAPKAHTEIENLFLGGDYCDTDMYVPTMEKAAESGFRAAKCVCDYLKITSVDLIYKDYNKKNHRLLRQLDHFFYHIFPR